MWKVDRSFVRAITQRNIYNVQRIATPLIFHVQRIANPLIFHVQRIANPLILHVQRIANPLIYTCRVNGLAIRCTFTPSVYWDIFCFFAYKRMLFDWYDTRIRCRWLYSDLQKRCFFKVDRNV